MSEIHRRRGFALLGLLLLVESTVGLLPFRSLPVEIEAIPLLLTLMQYLLPAALGVFMLAAFRKESFIRAAVRAVFVAIVGISLQDLVTQVLASEAGRGGFSLQPASTLLFNLGMPILWASALARREHPGDPVLQKVGRISAGFVQLGFVFQFVVRVRNWGTMGSLGLGSDSASAATTAYAASSLMEVASGLLLLWASVEAVRTASDEDAVRRRAHRIHRLMLWELILFPAVSLLFQLSFFLRDGSSEGLGRNLWLTALHPTMLFSTTFVLARWYLLQFPASSSPLERSGGVESTGESS